MSEGRQDAPSSGSATPSTPGTGPGGFLSGLLRTLKEKDRETREREDRVWHGLTGTGTASAGGTPRDASDGSVHASASPLPPSPGGAAAALSTPDRQQAALVTAALSRRKEAAAAASAKDKFLGLFKSDAEKRVEREREAAAMREREEAHMEAQARTRAAEAAALEPIKLELQLADPGATPMVGRAIRATAARASKGASSAPASASASSSPPPAQLSCRGVYRWFRASPDGGFAKVSETVAPLYIPTLDDLECRVCCQWVEEMGDEGADNADQSGEVSTAASTDPSTPSSVAPRRAPLQSSFGELGPIQMDPALLAESLALFKGGKATLMLREQDTEELVSIVVKRTMIRVLPAQGGEVKCAFLIRRPAATADAAAPAASPTAATPAPSLRVVLDPVDPLRFSLEDSGSQKVFRGSVMTDGDALAQYAAARRLRDSLACLVRRIVRTGSEALPAEGEATSAAASAASAVAGVPVPAASASHAATSSSPVGPIVTVNLLAAPSDSPDLVQLDIALAAPRPPSASLTIAVSSPSPPPSATPAAPAASLPPSGASGASPLISTSVSSLPPRSASPAHSPSLLPGHSPSPSQHASLLKRVSELTAEKNLFRENLNLVLEDKQRSDAAAAASISDLQARLAARESECASLQRSLNQSGEDVDSLKLAIQTLSTQMSNSANTEVRLSTEVRVLKGEREALQTELRMSKEAHASKVAEMEAAYAQLQKEHQQQSAQSAATAAEVATLQAEVRRLPALEERCARAQEAETMLRHDASLLQAELAKLREVQTKLEAVEMENHQLRKERDKKRHISNSSTTGAATAPTDTLAATAAHARSSSDQRSAPNTPVVTEANTGAAAIAKPDSSHSPNGRPASSPSSSATAAAAALLRLTEQHALLQSQHGELLQQHAATVADLEAARQQVATLEAEGTQHAAALSDLQTKVDALTASQDEAIASRNFYKRKCESLSSSMDKMLQSADAASAAAAAANSVKGVARPSLSHSGSSSKLSSDRAVSVAADSVSLSAREQDRQSAELLHLRATVVQLREEITGLHQTLAAYKRTLDSNYELLKVEREANMSMAGRAGGGAGAAGGGMVGSLFSLRGSSSASKSSVLQHQFDSVRALANSLSELVADKDASLEHLKKCNLLLGARVHELERRFERELEEAGDTAKGKSWFGKIHLEDAAGARELEGEKDKHMQRGSAGEQAGSRKGVDQEAPSAAHAPSPAGAQR